MRSHQFDSVVTPQVMDHLVRRECARSDRNGSVFSMVLFRVPTGRRKRTLAMHRLARTMLKRARFTDEIGWVGENHLAAMLPDTGAEGARAFADGVSGAVAARQPKPRAIIYSYPRDPVANFLTPDVNAVSTARSSNRAISIKPARANEAAQIHGVNSDGHAPLTDIVFSRANGNGRTRTNGNGHSDANGNGHSPRNGNGHGHINGNGHESHEGSKPRTNGNGHHDTNGNGHALAVLDRPKTAMAVEPRLARPKNDEFPVAQLEELLMYPMPRWKRILDIVGAVTMLTLLAPVMLAAAIAIKLSSPGPACFWQRRSGLGGKPFMICKFRTMIVNAEKQQAELRKLNEQDGPAFKLARDPRITRVGAFLRKTSIDELPQLWNVIRGEMSLVGPRPLPIQEQEACEPWQRHRLNVTPGLTCIWQVKGRSSVTFAEWVRMDVTYMRRRTILHDFTILLSTIPAVLLRRGAR